MPPRRFDTLEDVIPLTNVTVAVRGEMPRAVYLAPSRQPLPATEADGYAQVTIPEVHGHAMLVLEG